MSKAGVSALLERAFSWRGLLGRGGMGEVFEGLHLTSGSPIVLKCPHRAFSQTLPDNSAAGLSQRLFHREAQLAARLRHPHIVPVYDYGVLDAPLLLGDAQLEAGRPFVVMAKVQGQPLSHVHGELSWLPVIATLLEAIAYAHAQGVLHRDLKPSNILWDAQAQAPVIIDLGLAALSHDVRAQRGGTLAYAAPEQLLFSHGEGYGEGPWTDLYAIGCIAFELMTGALPFVGSTSQELIEQKRAGVLPALAGLPVSLRAWFGRMLAREPEDRYPHASLARQDLLRCEAALGQGFVFDPAQAPQTHELTQGSQLASWGWSAQLMAADHQELSAPDGDLMIADGDGSGLEQFISIPDWTSLEHDLRWPAVLPGLGQGVYQWRTLPLFGREQARQRLWDELKSLNQPNSSNPASPLVTLICGEAGCGKSRLVSWLSSSSEAIGLSYTLWITFDINAKDSDEPLRLAMLRYFGCDGLLPAQAKARLTRRLAPLRALSAQAQFVLSQWLIPGEHKVLPAAQERLRAWGALVLALATERPLIVVMDDWPWGRVCFEWMRGLFNEASPSARLWLLATARQETLEQDEQASAQAQALERMGARHERLGALDERAHRQLIARLLTLEDDQAALLAARTAGNPLYAVQLAGAWLELGQLMATPTGFEATVALEQTLPQDLTALSLTRLNLALAPFGPRAWRALGAAALFGPSLDDRQWRAFATFAGLDAQALLAALIERGLAAPEPYGWRFMHGILRETLLHAHHGMGGLVLAHDDCARLLDESLPESSSQRLNRIPYLIGSGQLLEATRELKDMSGSASQDELFATAQRLEPFVEGLPPAKVQLLFAIWHAHRNYGHIELAATTLKQLEALTQPLMSDPRIRLNLQLATYDFHVSGKDDAELERGMLSALNDEAISEHPDLHCFPLGSLGDLYQLQGRYEESLTCFLDALKVCPQKPWNMAWLYYSLASVLSSMERFEESARYSAMAKELFEALDLPMGLASCMVLDAEQAYVRGDLVSAYALNHSAYEIYVMVGDLGDILTAENLARLALKLGDLADTERWALCVYDAMQERAAKAMAHDILAFIYAEQSRWDELEALLAHPCDPMLAVSDSPHLLQLAIERTTSAPRPDLVSSLTTLLHQIQLAPGVCTDGS